MHFIHERRNREIPLKGSDLVIIDIANYTFVLTCNEIDQLQLHNKVSSK